MAAEPPQEARCCAAQSCRVLDEDVEDRLQIERRGADYLEDFTRRRLLLERFGHLGVRRRERPVLLLEFCEQPHVLDGDHGLVGESLEQTNLSIGEWSGC